MANSFSKFTGIFEFQNTWIIYWASYLSAS